MQSERSIRIVLDANTIVSALFGSDSKPAEVLARVISGKVINCISNDILKEVESVLLRPKIVKKTKEHERNYILQLLTSISVFVAPKQKLDVIKDDDADNRILECALEAKIGYIISGDTYLLRLQEYKGVKIVNSNEFLRSI